MNTAWKAERCFRVLYFHLSSDYLLTSQGAAHSRKVNAQSEATEWASEFWRKAAAEPDLLRPREARCMEDARIIRRLMHAGPSNSRLCQQSLNGSDSQGWPLEWPTASSHYLRIDWKEAFKHLQVWNLDIVLAQGFKFGQMRWDGPAPAEYLVQAQRVLRCIAPTSLFRARCWNGYVTGIHEIALAQCKSFSAGAFLFRGCYW